MRFSVVIPTMRREEILAETLASLETCDPCPDEVIVVDSDDEGSSRPVVTAFDRVVPLAVRYLRAAPSLTRQRNLGIDDASGEIVVFFDDDVSVRPDIFARLDEVYRDERVVGATGKVIEPDPTAAWGRARRFAGSSKGVRERSRHSAIRDTSRIRTPEWTSSSCPAAS